MSASTRSKSFKMDIASIPVVPNLPPTIAAPPLMREEQELPQRNPCAEVSSDSDSDSDDAVPPQPPVLTRQVGSDGTPAAEGEAKKSKKRSSSSMMTSDEKKARAKENAKRRRAQLKEVLAKAVAAGLVPPPPPTKKEIRTQEKLARKQARLAKKEEKEREKASRVKRPPNGWMKHLAQFREQNTEFCKGRSSIEVTKAARATYTERSKCPTCGK